MMTAWRRSAVARFLPLVVSAVLLCPPRAQASIFGEENATLGAILGESIAQLAEMAKTVAGITAQIQQLRMMITQGETMITQGETILRGAADPNGIENLLRYAQNTLRVVQRVDNSAKLLKYKLEQIDEDREDVFSEASDVPTKDFSAKAHKWNAALKESSGVAMRAQTSVETLQKRMDRMEELLTATDGASGVVEQLQLVVRSLGVLHTDLASIEANIAYGQRVTATMGAVEAAEAERSEELHKRMIDGYTNRGAPARVLEDLP